MIPYADFQFFYIVGLLLIPAVMLGLLGKQSKYYNLTVTALMIYLIFSNSKYQILSLIAYFFWQWVIIKVYSLIRKNTKSLVPYRIALVFSLLPLIVIKLDPLLKSQKLQGITGITYLTAFGFLGISYLTFKSLQMIIELKDGLIKEANFLDFAVFQLFFPTISSGPIDRYRRFTNDFNGRVSRTEYTNMLYKGINFVFLGFLYKFILAYLLKVYWLDVVEHESKTLLHIVSYMYAYSFHLFFDFAGYSAFAVGISYVLGIKTPENFNKPFISVNIKDFWNRWHISLSTWFRDYVNMRLIMSLARKKLIKNRLLMAGIGYFVSMGLMGIWHGTQLNYIVYGLYHGALLSGYEVFEKWNKKTKWWGDGPIYNALSVIITFHCVCFGFLIFSGKLF